MLIIYLQVLINLSQPWHVMLILHPLHFSSCSKYHLFIICFRFFQDFHVNVNFLFFLFSIMHYGFIFNAKFWQMLRTFALPGCLPKMCPISKIIASCKFIFCLTNVQTNSLVQHRFLFLSFNSCTSLFYMHIRVWKEVVTNIYIRKIQLLCCGHMQYGSQIGCEINYKASQFFTVSHLWIVCLIILFFFFFGQDQDQGNSSRKKLYTRCIRSGWSH